MGTDFSLIEQRSRCLSHTYVYDFDEGRCRGWVVHTVISQRNALPALARGILPFTQDPLLSGASASATPYSKGYWRKPSVLLCVQICGDSYAPLYKPRIYCLNCPLAGPICYPIPTYTHQDSWKLGLRHCTSEKAMRYSSALCGSLVYASACFILWAI